jgi:predicted transcriptional regulator
LDDKRASDGVENTRQLTKLQSLCDEVGVKEIALRSGIDASNLAKMLKGKRPLSNSMRNWLNGFFRF